MARIGIMGGTFNPIHNAHLQIAQEALEELKLDKVLFIPTGQPYMNKDMSDVLDADSRGEMTRLGISGNPLFSFSDLEIKRQGTSYTCDTLKELHALYPEDTFYLLVGSDSFMGLGNWKDSTYIFSAATIALTLRSSVPEADIMRQKEYYEETFGAKICMVSMPLLEISSSDIRRRVRKNLSIRYLVPEKVADYIHQKKLYL